MTSRGLRGCFVSSVLVASVLGVGALPAQAAEDLVGSATADYEVGALSIQGRVPGPAFDGSVDVFNDVGNRPGKVGFQIAPRNLLGRTNGEGNDGVAERAFAFKFRSFNGAPAWQNTVPFAFGTKGGRDTLWTPQFINVGMQPVHMGQFSIDNDRGNRTRDEDPRPGIIERGDFRAIDGDSEVGATVNCNRPGKVCFQRFNGSEWRQIGRTNGTGDDGDLVSFTVIRVRTGYTLDSSGRIVNVNQDIPVAQVNGIDYGRFLGLQTPNYGNNIGTQTLLKLPKLP